MFNVHDWLASLLNCIHSKYIHQSERKYQNCCQNDWHKWRVPKFKLKVHWFRQNTTYSSLYLKCLRLSNRHIQLINHIADMLTTPTFFRRSDDYIIRSDSTRWSDATKMQLKRPPFSEHGASLGCFTWNVGQGHGRWCEVSGRSSGILRTMYTR